MKTFQENLEIFESILDESSYGLNLKKIIAANPNLISAFRKKFPNLKDMSDIQVARVMMKKDLIKFGKSAEVKQMKKVMTPQGFRSR